MKKSNETDSLNELIALYEEKHDYELKAIKDQFHLAYESLKPINLIKNVVHEVSASPEIKNDLVSNVIGFGTGFISKKLLLDKSQNPVKRVLGTALQFAVANLVAKHSDTIKSIGGGLVRHFFNKAEKK